MNVTSAFCDSHSSITQSFSQKAAINLRFSRRYFSDDPEKNRYFFSSKFRDFFLVGFVAIAATQSSVLSHWPGFQSRFFAFLARKTNDVLRGSSGSKISDGIFSRFLKDRFISYRLAYCVSLENARKVFENESENKKNVTPFPWKTKWRTCRRRILTKFQTVSTFQTTCSKKVTDYKGLRY